MQGEIKAKIKTENSMHKFGLEARKLHFYEEEKNWIPQTKFSAAFR